jgi:hypothetical protein
VPHRLALDPGQRRPEWEVKPSRGGRAKRLTWYHRQRILGGGGDVANMNPAVIKVEVERPRVAFAERERRSRLGGVGEAMQFSQSEAPWV